MLINKISEFKRVFLLISTSCLLLFSFSGHANGIVDTGDCVSNCIKIVQNGKSSFLVWRGVNSQIKKIIPLELPENSKLTNTQSVSSEYYAASITSGGPGVTITSVTYETATHYVIVTTYTYYGPDGNIVDIQIHVQRFDKKQSSE